MLINKLTFRRCFLTLLVLIGFTSLCSVTVFSGPSKVVDDWDTINLETWKVWTEFTGVNQDIKYCRTIDGIDTPADFVNAPNSEPDMDAAISGCDACPKPLEKVWCAWERYETTTTGGDTDIIMSTRSIGTGWGIDIYPHYNNNYDDFNPDILGDSLGHVWIVWVVYLELENEYQLRYTYYNGIGGSDSGWSADNIIHVGDLYDGSEPHLFENPTGVINVTWKNIENQKFEKILPIPMK